LPDGTSRSIHCDINSNGRNDVAVNRAEDSREIAPSLIHVSMASTTGGQSSTVAI